MKWMELPPGISNHADMVRSLTGSLLELDAVLPFYRHQFELVDTEFAGQTGTAISKFKTLEPIILKKIRLASYKMEKISLADLIDPPALRSAGFNAYVRNILEEANEESPRRRLVPDLWFEFTPLKANQYGLTGEVLGLIEIVDSSDMTSEKWHAFLDLAEQLDCIGGIWTCLLRRELHSPYFSCEFFGP